jgi:hypothetical protein
VKKLIVPATLVLAPFLALAACVAWLSHEREATMTEADRMQARVVFVRMPGRPDVCVAALRGVGAFRPTFLGASPCSEVRDRAESDEEISFDLAQLVIVRVEGTGTCLAYGAEEGRFTLPCGPDD